MCRSWEAFYDPDGVLNTEPGYMVFEARNCTDYTSVYIGLNPIFESGYYRFSDSIFKDTWGGYVIPKSGSGIWNYKVFEGWVDFEKLEPQTYQPFTPGWIEGTFEMSCANESGDTVHITEGVFGLRLR